MRSLAGGMGVSALTALLAVVTWRQVEGSGAGGGALPAPTTPQQADPSLGGSRITPAGSCDETEKILRGFRKVHAAPTGRGEIEFRHLVDRIGRVDRTRPHS